ncbi:hypothetical protein KM043_009312 [Ampulex compressa]|nr:hypothetical protein KM043_009312 [Ampulex compressa]
MLISLIGGYACYGERVALIVWLTILTASSDSNSTANVINKAELPAYSYIYEVKENAGRGQRQKEEQGSGSEGVTGNRYSISIEHLPDQWRYYPVPKNDSRQRESTSTAKSTDVQINDDDAEGKGYTESQHRTIKQIVQPYTIEAVVVESDDGEAEKKFTRGFLSEVKQGSRTDEKSTIEGITMDDPIVRRNAQADLSVLSSDKHPQWLNAELSESGQTAQTNDPTEVENAGGFGQRVRLSALPRERNAQGFFRIKGNIFENAHATSDESDTPKFHRLNNTRVRISSVWKAKRTRLPLNLSDSQDAPKYLDNIPRVANESTKNEDLTKDSKVLKEPKIPKDQARVEYEEADAIKSMPNAQMSDERLRLSIDEMYKPKRHRTPLHDDPTSSSTNQISNQNPSFNQTSVSSLYSGKFFGPIVVPDLPKYQKFSYITVNYDNNEVSSTPLPESQTLLATSLSSTPDSRPETRPKTLPNFLTTSATVLNPIQVGVTLVNAGDVRLFNDSSNVSMIKTKLPDEDPEKSDDMQNERYPSESAASYDVLEVQYDQASEQEQVSEVTQKSPVESVEIQKSVELYHTAPVHEIHYPVEYVPQQQAVEPQVSSLPQKSSQQFLPQDEQSAQLGFQVYKSNEIGEEGGATLSRLQQLPQERNRYEYSTNENEVNRPAFASSPVPSIVRQITGIPLIVRSKGAGGSASHGSSSGYKSAYQTNSVKPSVHQESSWSNQGTDNSPGTSYLDASDGNQDSSQSVYSNIPPPSEPKFLLPIPQPYPVEKVVEKTVHVPHTIEIEKVIEKKVPYAVEKVIEKQVTIPQPYPVHVPIDRLVEKQIRLPHLYPVHVERVIEKKIPYALHRLLVQPFPLHVKLPYAVEKPLEKVVIEKSMERGRPFPVEITKFLVKPYPSQYELAYQQASRVPNFYATAPPVSINDAQNNVEVYHQSSYGKQPVQDSPETRGSNVSRNYVPLGHFNRQPSSVASPKKFNSYGYHSHGSLPSYPASHRRLIVFKIPDKDRALKDDYLGPISLRHGQNSLPIQSKSSQFAPAEAQLLAAAGPLRRPRQPEGSTGSFRQSKMEYGFKPPMVPSVQYDENTATKVE